MHEVGDGPSEVRRGKNVVGRGTKRLDQLLKIVEDVLFSQLEPYMIDAAIAIGG